MSLGFFRACLALGIVLAGTSAVVLAALHVAAYLVESSAP